MSRVSKFYPLSALSVKITSICDLFQETPGSDQRYQRLRLTEWRLVVACLGLPEARTISCESRELGAGPLVREKTRTTSLAPTSPQPHVNRMPCVQLANYSKLQTFFWLFNAIVDYVRTGPMTRIDGTEMNSEFLFHWGGWTKLQVIEDREMV